MASSKPHNEEDVTTFSGFGSWMSTLEPQAAPPYDGRRQSGHQRQSVVHELDSGHGVMHELYAGGGAVELPGGDSPGHQVKLPPAPVPAPAPQPVWNPRQIHAPGPQIYSPYPPIPNPHPQIYNPTPHLRHPPGPQPIYHPPSQPIYNPNQPIYNPQPIYTPTINTPIQPIYSPTINTPTQPIYPPPPPNPVPQPIYPPAPYNPGPRGIYIPQPYPQPYPHPQPQPMHPPKPVPQPAPLPIKKKPLNTSKIVFEEVPDPMTRVKVSGLQKVGQTVQFTEALDFSANCFLEDIAKKLTSSGYKLPLGFATDPKNARTLSNSTGGLQESRWPILLTTGKSCYDTDIGLRMHVDEPFTVFLTRMQLSVKCADSRILVNEGDLQIAFHRTLRVPEDGQTHKLPASFGRFPIQNIAAYQKKLINSKNASLLDMARKGGVFFPVFQREAMWLSFNAAKGSEYKIRVFVGGVNVVTGKKWDDESNSDSYGDEDQDYILVPPQEHLDGIAVGNGIVQQFIAMPVGSGYSIEKQITGKEDVGGVQLEISPRNRNLQFYCRGKDVQWQNSKDPTIPMTPRLCGLHPGEIMSMMRSNTLDTLPFLGGKLRKQQKTTLRELVETKGLVPSVTTLTALYPVTLQIKMPGTFVKPKITTPPFSPLEDIRTVILKSVYKGKDLSEYSLSFNNVLGEFETIMGAGLYDGAVLTAFKNFKAPEPPAAITPWAPVPQFQNMSIEDKPTYGSPPQQPYQQQPSPGVYSPPMLPLGSPPPQQQYQHYSSPAPYNPPMQQSSPAPAAYQSPLQYSQGASSPGPQSSSPEYYGGTYETAPSPVQYSVAAPPETSGSPYQAYSSPAMSPTPVSSPPESHDEPDYEPGYAPLKSARQSAPPMTFNAPQPQSPSQTFGALPEPLDLYTNTGPPRGAPPTSPQSYASPPSATSPPKHPPKPQETESWAMSLAAGGRIAQQVHLDPTPLAYRSSTPSATALVNVQLLNAVAYETLTGLLCPPTPITPKQYAEAGIPWFDSYAPESRSAAGGAAFSALRSVGEIDASSHIEASTSVAASQKVACTSCRRNLCDCVLRPCNHAFCGECVKGRMLEIADGNRRVARCLLCRGVAEKVLGFSAPMALPGYEEFVPDGGAQVVVKAGSFGRGVVFELE